MAPARPAENTIEQRKTGVSNRCNGHRKTVVKTRREASPGANPFNLPYRVRLLSICTPLPCAAGECIRRKAACKVYDAGYRVKLGVPEFRVRHKWRHKHTENRCADRVLDGPVRTSLYLALTGSQPISKRVKAASRRHVPHDAIHAMATSPEYRDNSKNLPGFRRNRIRSRARKCAPRSGRRPLTGCNSGKENRCGPSGISCHWALRKTSERKLNRNVTALPLSPRFPRDFE